MKNISIFVALDVHKESIDIALVEDNRNSAVRYYGTIGGDLDRDITYLPMARGHMYLIAIMDWATRRVLSWWLSNTLDTRFCVEALKEALFKYGAPEIFNTVQGCQFTSEAFTSVLKTWNIRISMDGKGRFKDNIFIERLLRTLKYERIYLKEYETGAELFKDLTIWFTHYNEKRKHSSLDKRTLDKAYFQGLEKLKQSA